MAVPSPEERVAPLRTVVQDVTRQFPELGYLGPNGVLSVPVDVGPVTGIRLELPKGFLHVQSIGLVADDGSDASAGAEVTASSWYGSYGDAFDPERLLDWESPTGTVVHTLKDDLSWVEVRTAGRVRLREVRLRNVDDVSAVRAQRLRVLGLTRWRRRLLFDGAKRQRHVHSAVHAFDVDLGDAEVRALVPVLAHTLAGSYSKARKTLREAGVDPELEKAFRGVVNEELLPSREQLWTTHGPSRAFRFWTEKQQREYVAFTAEVVEAVREVTPHACLGFGAVLAVVRDKALIPHDDDLDIVVAFEPGEASTIAEGLSVVTRALEERGFSVRGNYASHRQVGRHHKGKHVDVFVGLFEGDAVSWYPGTRGALSRETMFPTTTAPLLGVELPIPARPEEYLRVLYGDTWHTPDPHFAHRWDRSAYADISGAAPAD